MNYRPLIGITYNAEQLVGQAHFSTHHTIILHPVCYTAANPHSLIAVIFVAIPTNKKMITNTKDNTGLRLPSSGASGQYNFNSGPSILPTEVFEEAANGVLNFNGSGLSILEIGHRTKLFGAVIEEAIATLKELMKLDSEHEVLFLHGGASTQFFQVPMNLLNEQKTAAYTDTGIWGSKAIKEAKLFGNVDVVCSSKGANYNYLPKDFVLDSSKHAYVHITSNETVYGTQWHDLSPFYNSGVPIVADMSSDILSRQLDFNRFDLIYAGAQKNIGACRVSMW
jgi:phosphoserine aminotransferase